MKSERKTMDQRPGAVPEIRAEGDSVIFCLGMSAERACLLIRCNPDGTIGVSIDFGKPLEPQP